VGEEVVNEEDGDIAASALMPNNMVFEARSFVKLVKAAAALSATPPSPSSSPSASASSSPSPAETSQAAIAPTAHAAAVAANTSPYLLEPYLPFCPKPESFVSSGQDVKDSSMTAPPSSQPPLPPPSPEAEAAAAAFNAQQQQEQQQQLLQQLQQQRPVRQLQQEQHQQHQQHHQHMQEDSVLTWGLALAVARVLDRARASAGIHFPADRLARLGRGGVGSGSGGGGAVGAVSGSGGGGGTDGGGVGGGSSLSSSSSSSSSPLLLPDSAEEWSADQVASFLSSALNDGGLGLPSDVVEALSLCGLAESGEAFLAVR
jgi:hypothetical protein